MDSTKMRLKNVYLHFFWCQNNICIGIEVRNKLTFKPVHFKSDICLINTYESFLNFLCSIFSNIYCFGVVTKSCLTLL